MNNILDNLAIKNDAVKKIQAITSNCSHFKIGKTGQSLSDRFDSAYKNEYDRIKLIYNSNDQKIVDDLESYLIDRFLSFDKYKSICDNRAIGSGEMEDSEIYHVYVVLKD